jgi:flavin reductase (DIM6/NTAB) family NADH-FMN oxidoreductase RutF
MTKSGAEPFAPVSADEFRRLLSSFATGVTVVTARAPDPEGQLVGMTASAVASVSLTPPLLLVSVGTDARLHRVLAGDAWFTLNVLAANQEALSHRFASGETDLFTGVAYELDDHGVPLLHGVVAHIQCRTWRGVSAGDHTVYFGEVVGGRTFDRPALVHYRSLYVSTPNPPGSG